MTELRDRRSSPTAESIEPALILAQIKLAGVTHVVTVPDTHQKSLLNLLIEGEGPSLITVCTEDEAVGVNLGLYIGGRRPMLLIQNSGFYAAINTIRGLALDGQVPTCMLIGEFFRDTTKPPAAHASRLVRMLEPTLDLWDIPSFRLDHESDLPALVEAYDLSWSRRGPVAVIVGATTVDTAS